MKNDGKMMEIMKNVSDRDFNDCYRFYDFNFDY